MELYYYIVSLKGSEDQYKNTRQALIDIGVPAHRINLYEAVDGRKPSTREKVEQEFPEVRLVPDGTFGCASSHINLVKELSNTFKDYSQAVPVILEDDARPLFHSESILHNHICKFDIPRYT